jgi:hypothetical protein
MSLRLIIEDDEGTTTIVPLGEDAVTIGRQQGNTIQLTEKNVSRRHARLFPDSDRWIIEDLGSYNGVNVNGQCVEGRIDLKEGDVIEIGDYHLALTDSAGKRTLNYDPLPDAANDNEPMLASSSTDLPRLSAEELSALQSGPTTPQPGTSLLDSGPVPAMVGPVPFTEDTPRRNPALMLGIAVATVGALALGFFWIANEPQDPTGDEPIASPDPPHVEVAVPVDGDSLPGEPADSSPLALAGADEAAPGESDTDPSGALGDETGDDTDEAQGADPPTTQADPEPPSTKPRRVKKPRKSPPTTPPAAPTPTVDADALLKEARDLQYQNPSKAYSLAAQAFNAKKDKQAIIVMVNTACRMKDAAKARKALARLKGEEREVMTKSCRTKGVDV